MKITPTIFCQRLGTFRGAMREGLGSGTESVVLPNQVSSGMTGVRR